MLVFAYTAQNGDGPFGEKRRSARRRKVQHGSQAEQVGTMIHRLSVRLFANMMAGHTMLKVFAGFVVGMGVVGGWAPLALMVAFTGLEVLIAFLQAYVFAVLTCIYLNDAINMHH